MLHKLKQSPAHRIAGDPLYATQRGSPTQELSQAEKRRLEEMWPILLDRLRMSEAISADYVAEKCFISRFHATQWLIAKGCYRTGTKWRLTGSPAPKPYGR